MLRIISGFIPAYPHPTQVVAVSGTGFTASEAVDVYIDTTDTLLLVSSATGTLTGSVTLPASALPGAHYVTAIGRRSGDAAQAAFTVTTPWAELGFGAAHRGWNPYENTVGVGNVASFGELWSAGAYSNGTMPAISQKKVVVATTAGVAEFSTSTGTQIWSSLTSNAFYGSPAISGTSVYIASINAAALYTLSLTTGATLHTTTLGSGAYSSPVVANGIVYFGSQDTNVYAFTAREAGLVWKFKLPSIPGGAIVANGVLYITSRDGALYALNAAYGTEIATFCAGYSFLGTPAISDGVLYLSTEGGRTYAYGLLADVNAAHAPVIPPSLSILHPDMRLTVSPNLAPSDKGPNLNITDDAE